MIRHLVEYTETWLAAIKVYLMPISVEESENLDVHDIDGKKRHLAVTRNGRRARSAAVQFSNQIKLTLARTSTLLPMGRQSEAMRCKHGSAVRD